MNVKITELPLSDPLTGTEVLPIVQDGATVKATAQDVANLASPFSALINIQTAIVDIKDAVEGVSIPDSATDNYTKTIPIGFSPTTALCVLLVNSLGNAVDLRTAGPLTYGVASTGDDSNLGSIPPIPNPNDALSLNGEVETGIRILVNGNFSQAKRAQSMIKLDTTYDEVDEAGISLPGGHALSYIQLNNNLIGRYNGPFTPGSIGVTSSSGINAQDTSIIKSAYISGSNLVLLLKKTSATSGETWNRLQFRVYDLS